MYIMQEFLSELNHWCWLPPHKVCFRNQVEIQSSRCSLILVFPPWFRVLKTSFDLKVLDLKRSGVETYHDIPATCLETLRLSTQSANILPVRNLKVTVILHQYPPSNNWDTPSAKSFCTYSGPCILRPPVQLDKYGLKLEVVLKWRDIYTEKIRMVSQIAVHKMEGIVKWRGLKLHGPLHSGLSLKGHSLERTPL